jgi:hypothetical protein
MLFTRLLAKSRSVSTRWKSLSRGQKAKRIILFVVLLALILVITDWFSPRTIIGIDRDYITKSVSGQNLYEPQTFETKTTMKNGPSGVVVSISYPVSGNLELDEAILTEAAAFADSIAKTAEKNESYNQSSFVYGKKVFVTFSNSDPASTSRAFATFGFTQDGVLDKNFFTQPGYEPVITEYISEYMNKTFGVQRETMSVLISKALTDKDYRLAANGLVVQFPMKDLPKQITGASYYEVLVPMDAIKSFIE